MRGKEKKKKEKKKKKKNKMAVKRFYFVREEKRMRNKIKISKHEMS